MRRHRLNETTPLTVAALFALDGVLPFGLLVIHGLIEKESRRRYRGSGWTELWCYTAWDLMSSISLSRVLTGGSVPAPVRRKTITRKKDKAA